MQVGVLLSGGVDSLYTLLLLKEAGYKVIGLHGLFFDSESQQEVISRLKKIATTFDIPLHLLNLKESFFSQVIAPFISSFQQGLTPNPCSICNPRIKFGLLLEQAKQLGCTKIASGHYACLQENKLSPLARGKDSKKDQSYFLALIPKKNFKHILFPLGNFKKQQVYKEIERRNLLSLVSSESNEVCFIPGDYRNFLKKHQVSLGKPGPIKLLNGTTIGTHKGLVNYTLGQRRGLGLAYKFPLYVLAKDLKQNILYVGPKEELKAKGAIVSSFNFLAPLEKWPKSISVQIRYRQKPKQAKLVKVEGPNLYFQFLEPEEKPAPGQTLVVFYGKEVLGGGIIQGEL